MDIKGLNECRCIARHELGFYRGLKVAAIYQLPLELTDSHIDDGPDARLQNILIAALSACVKQHPIMRTIIRGATTERPELHQADEVKLGRHLSIKRPSDIIAANSGSEKAASKKIIEGVIEFCINDTFADVSRKPPWKVIVVPLPACGTESNQKIEDIFRFVVAYVYSHSHGGGSSGLAFHRTFCEALQAVRTHNSQASAASKTLWTADDAVADLPPALDAPRPLSISWWFLLQTLAKEFLPSLPAVWGNSMSKKV